MKNSTVRLEFPASSGYLVLARTAVAALCARLDYPIDRLEDVKLAIDEACSLLLADATATTTLELELTAEADGHLNMDTSATTKHGRPPKRTSFAWTVLTALVDDVDAGAEDGKVTIHMRASRGDALPGVNDSNSVGA